MSRCPVRHDFIAHFISTVFAAYGRFLSRHPYIVLIVTIGFGVFLATGIRRLRVTSLEIEDFTPQDSQALRDRVLLKEFEEVKNSGALPTDNGNETNCRYGEVVFVARKGINLFTLKSLVDILSVENQFWAEHFDSSIPGVKYTYNETCLRVNNACFGPTMRLFATFVPQLRDLLNMDPAMAKDPAFADFMEASIIETGVELTYPYYHGQFIAATLSEVVFRAPRNDTEDPFAVLLPASKISGPVGSWGIVESVGVLREVYLACFDLDERVAGDNWDNAFDRILRAETKKNHVFELYWHSNKKSEANIVATALKLIPLFILTLVALAFFSMVATLWGDAVSSKPVLGFLGIVITGFAIFSSFGLMAWLDQPFVTIAIATPFLALAVGLDDMHVLLGGWRLTDRRLPVWRRMEDTLREAGTSIFITFLTNMIGFVIGTYMPYPAIQKLSLFTTAAMCLDFGFQLTLFCSCLVLFGRLEAANRHSLVPCVKVTQPMISFRNSVTSAILCGSRHISDYTLVKCETGAGTITTPLSMTPPTTSPSTSRSSSAGVDVEVEGSGKVKVSTKAVPTAAAQQQKQQKEEQQHEPDIESSAISQFFAFYYTPLLLSRAGKVFVFLLYMGYLVHISFGISHLQIGFRAQNLFPRESASYNWYLKIRGHFRSYWPQIPIIFTSQLEYANPYVQEELDELYQKLEASQYLWDREVTRFWLFDYLPLYRQWTTGVNDTLFIDGNVPQHSALSSHVEESALSTTPYPVVSPSESQFFYLLRTRFLNMPEYKAYESDLIWNWNETAIVRSRGWVVGKNLSSPDCERSLLGQIRTLIDGFRLCRIAAFSLDFILYEQHASIIYNCMYNVLIAIAAVLITTAVMTPYLSCMFWLAVCLISIVLGLFGLMSDCNIDLDSVSMVTIIIGVGFSTDFIAHFTYGYLMDEGKTTRAKADGALRDVGSATVPTAIGTIMSVLAMSSSSLYVYVVFFKMMSLTIALCALHSLVFLPVILSMLGPLPVTRRQMKNEKIEKEAAIKVVVHKTGSKDALRVTNNKNNAETLSPPPHKSKSEPNFATGNKSRSKSNAPGREIRPVSDGAELNSANKSSQRRPKRHLQPLPASVSAVFTAAGNASGPATTASTTLSGGSASVGEDHSSSDLSAPSSRRQFIVHEFGMTAKSAADRRYEATMLGTQDGEMQLDHPASSAEKVRAYLHQINRQKPQFTI